MSTTVERRDVLDRRGKGLFADDPGAAKLRKQAGLEAAEVLALALVVLLALFGLAPSVLVLAFI